MGRRRNRARLRRDGGLIGMAIRVHQLASEFGVDTKTILAILREMGEYVKSASSTVEPPVVDRLRDRLRPQGASLSGVRPAPRAVNPTKRQRPGGNPFAGRGQNRRVTDPNLLDAAKMFGVSPESLRPAPKPKRKWVERPSGVHAMDDWDLLLMDRKERAEWLDAGLGEHDARLADTCKRFNIGPDDLCLVVEGRAVWERLRGNESITIIADMIRVEKARARREAG